MIHAFQPAPAWPKRREPVFYTERTPWLREDRMFFHGFPIRICTDWHDDDEELLWL